MDAVAWGMTVAGIAALAAGLVLVRGRMQAASGADRMLVLGPVFEAAALAMFAAEHFWLAREMAPMVPHWLPWHLFWTYFVGVALLAAAVSFIAWRCVRWSASLLALLFVIIVVTIDLPGLSAHAHDRLFWTLTVRELCFAGGAMVLAGSVGAWRGLIFLGRAIVAAVMVFYGIEHFFFPHNVTGVPLEKMTPAWVPAPVAIAYFIGVVLIVGGIGLLVPRYTRVSAAGVGSVLVLLTLLFYVPIFLTEMHTALAVEGLNYIGDTLLFAATVLLAGFGAGTTTRAE